MPPRTRIALLLLLAACAREPRRTAVDQAEGGGPRGASTAATSPVEASTVEASTDRTSTAEASVPRVDARGVGVVEASAPAVRYSGRVVDVDGSPLAGVGLGTWGSRSGAPLARSGSDGRFEFRAEPDPAAPRVQDDAHLDLVVGHGAGGELLVVVAPGELLAGRVLDAEGRPVAGASVRLEAARAAALPVGFVELRRTSPRHTATTVEDGRFRLERVPHAPGYVVVLEHPVHGRARVQLGAPTAGGAVERVVRLRRAGS